MLMLLKEKSQVAYKPKERKRFQPYLPEQRNQQIPRSSLAQQREPQESEKKEAKPKKIKPTVQEHFDTEMKK